MTTRILTTPRPSGSRHAAVVEVDQGDTPEAAHARVDLKLAASAYCEAGHRQDTGGRLVGAALVRLVQCGLLFYARLQRLDPRTLQQMASVVEEAQSGDLVDHAVARLQVQALAYATSRHGADACAELSRSAIGMLCQAAVEVAETTLSVLGVSTPASQPQATRAPALSLPAGLLR